MEPKTQTYRPGRIICNLSSTKYEIVRHVAKKVFGWKLSYEEDNEDWDIFWTDSAVQPEKLARMKHFQRINHFPGMYLISRKNYLAFNLGKLRKLFPNDYNFFPKTWVVPCDFGELKFFMNSKKNPYVIVKPEASCQGRGIYLTKRVEDINPEERHVVQQYLTKPFLIDNLKFDLRIYVLVTSCDPLRIFIHEDGLTRFATEEYEKPSNSNIEDMCMHLTNYAINKNNPNFVYNEDPECDDVGHKRSLKSTYDFLQQEGYDTDKLKSKIDSMIIKTLCAIQPNLSHHYCSCQADDYSRSMCFEILGFDVILDRKLNPYILEVNHTPSFSTDSPLDRKIKKQVISDTLNLVGVSLSSRKKYYKKQREDIIKRSLTGKIDRLTKDEKLELLDRFSKKRDKFEQKHLGGYRKIYPVNDSIKYEKYVQAADNIWQEWTGAKVVRTKRTENKSPLPSRNVKSVVSNPRVRVLQARKNDENSIDRPNSTIFDRLSQPIIRKYRSTTVGYLPGVVYTDKGDIKKDNTSMIITGEAEKIINKSRVLNNGSFNGGPLYGGIISSPAKITNAKNVAQTLKELLNGRQNALTKNRYIDYLLSNY